MHSLATGIRSSITATVGSGTLVPVEQAISTVFIAFAVSTLLVGVAFLLLGHFKLGTLTHFFPRHVLIGCVGGIGVFVTCTAMTISTGAEWAWTTGYFEALGSEAVWPLWVTALGLAIVLRIAQRFTASPVLAPLFFVLIGAGFYSILALTGYTIEDARRGGWLYDIASNDAGNTGPFAVYKLYDFSTVYWLAIVDNSSTLLALVAFSIIHIPVNVPTLSLTTGQPADVNEELLTHGISNLLSGGLGAFANYLCYCNSALFFKCGVGTGPSKVEETLRLEQAASASRGPAVGGATPTIPGARVLDITHTPRTPHGGHRGAGGSSSRGPAESIHARARRRIGGGVSHAVDVLADRWPGFFVAAIEIGLLFVGSSVR